jgi:hypothetical protein
MVDPVLGEKAAVLIENSELRVPLVSITSDSIMRHRCTSSSFACVLTRHECSGRCSTFI